MAIEQCGLLAGAVVVALLPALNVHATTLISKVVHVQDGDTLTVVDGTQPSRVGTKCPRGCQP